MGKKIVILNGSPRKSGNTSTLAAEFMRGAKESGNTITEFFLDGMNIRGCRGCLGGGRDVDHPCVTKDDMDEIYPVVKDADVIVLASPVYYWSISGQLKMTLDRLFAIAESADSDKLMNKDVVLLMSAQSNEYQEVKSWYQTVTEYLKWQDRGQILVDDVYKVGDIKDRKELTDAYQLGTSI